MTIPVSIVSRKTMKKIGTAKTLGIMPARAPTDESMNEVRSRLKNLPFQLKCPSRPRRGVKI